MTTTEQLPKNVERLKKSIDDWNTLSMKHRNFGAADTEPDGVFQHCIRKASLGEEFTVPKNAEDWQLYSEMKGVGRAAISLSAVLRRCIAAMDKIKLSERAALESYLDRVLWRA